MLPDQTLGSILDDVRDLDGAYRRAAALFERIADAYVYDDGNKRTPWTVAEAYLNDAGYEAVQDDQFSLRPPCFSNSLN